MSQTDFSELYNTKENDRFCIATVRLPYDAPLKVVVKIWIIEENQYHIAGFFIKDICTKTILGTPVTVKSESEYDGDYPKEVIEAVHKLLCLGLEEFDSRNRVVPKHDREFANCFLERRFPQDENPHE